MVAGETAAGAAAAAAAATAAAAMVAHAEELGRLLGDAVTGLRETLRANKPEVHHIATDKNRVSTRNGGPWTPAFEPMFEKAGVSMNSIHNKTLVFGHRGPHPEVYHLAIYNALAQATQGLDGDAYRNAFLGKLHELQVLVATPGTPLNLMVRGKD